MSLFASSQLAVKFDFVSISQETPLEEQEVFSTPDYTLPVPDEQEEQKSAPEHVPYAFQRRVTEDGIPSPSPHQPNSVISFSYPFLRVSIMKGWDEFIPKGVDRSLCSMWMAVIQPSWLQQNAFLASDSSTVDLCCL